LRKLLSDYLQAAHTEAARLADAQLALHATPGVGIQAQVTLSQAKNASVS
jgi:hypothetical protein